MYLTLSKKPRKANRNKSKRYRAKLKAKDGNRRGRVYQGVNSKGKKKRAQEAVTRACARALRVARARLRSGLGLPGA
jgi:hypothetical protein